MTYESYASVDELLAPETLTALTGEPVKYVRCLPMEGGFSGSSLLNVEANGDKRAECFVLKRMSVKRDWVMDATHDHRCRSVTLWQTGLLHRLQPTVAHATLACARDGDGWAMLMDDISTALMANEPFTGRQVYFLLDSLATLHATFWEAAELTDPKLGVCTTKALLQLFSPTMAHQFPGTTSPLPQRIIEGWPALQKVVAPDVADVLSKLCADPQPLCAALARYPATLVHGDYRYANLGLVVEPATQAILIDWQLAGYSAATIDLAWFLATPNVLNSPVATDVATEYYRQRLAEQLGERFNESCWQPLLALGQLANVLRSAWSKAWSVANSKDEAFQATQRRALERYQAEVRAALPWL